MSALGKLLMLAVVVIVTLLAYDYYLFKAGPKKWWRFWVKETPAAPAPAPATPVAGPTGSASAKTASAAASSPATASTMGGSISTTAKTA